MKTKINVIIPMAGKGARFKNQGFKDPKPFIQIDGKSLIEIVLENLALNSYEAEFFLVAQSSHLKSYKNISNRIINSYEANFIEINEMTRGSLDSISKAELFVSEDSPLIIANSDQFVELKMDDFISDAFTRNLDGSILVFEEKEKDPKWSFVKVNEKSLVTEVAEKQVISSYASVGVYYFKSTLDFFKNMRIMLGRGETINGEFYTCPIYNVFIEQNRNIGIYLIDNHKMHGLGTPEDLEKFILKKIAK
jgi:UDP-N-acetylglucosamine diphosphorylase / glucose-1-phosphate thymidylyltransferase / UDP-N-acetylgalactosamine diphosphorylase / glucosamine-1-phosphate N-acetyltransferase / galactosamine-1-phosphate N-acetyltransferase